MPELSAADDEVLPEYDFIGGVRGRHYEAMREGYTVKIDQADGTTLIQHFKLEEGTVLLDPDVRTFFWLRVFPASKQSPHPPTRR